MQAWARPALRPAARRWSATPARAPPHKLCGPPTLAFHTPSSTPGSGSRLMVRTQSRSTVIPGGGLPGGAERHAPRGRLLSLALRDAAAQHEHAPAEVPRPAPWRAISSRCAPCPPLAADGCKSLRAGADSAVRQRLQYVRMPACPQWLTLARVRRTARNSKATTVRPDCRCHASGMHTPGLVCRHAVRQQICACAGPGSWRLSSLAGGRGAHLPGLQKFGGQQGCGARPQSAHLRCQGGAGLVLVRAAMAVDGGGFITH